MAMELHASKIIVVRRALEIVDSYGSRALGSAPRMRDGASTNCQRWDTGCQRQLPAHATREARRVRIHCGPALPFLP